MNKSIYIFIIFTSFFGYSQNSENLKNAIKLSEGAKGGNYKDILSSMFQLASKNLTGNKKTIEFNSTLFALKAKINNSPKLDFNNYKQRFERNFQFNFKVKLDSTFKYNGFDGGITYAIVNQRDKHLANFVGSELNDLFDDLSDEITNQLSGLTSYSMTDINSTLKKILNNESDENYSAKELEIQKIIFQNLDTKFYTSAKTLKDGTKVNSSKEMVDNLHKLRTSYYQNLESKILWTIAASGSTNTDGKFNKASFGTIFLKGNKSAWNEVDVRGKITYADTLLTEHLPRTGFNAKAGLNFKIGKDKQQQSYFEIKTYFEYNYLFNNLTIDEKKNDLLANADIRIRLMDDLWIPITIKYDATNKGNFYGFLNVTYNFNPL